MKKKTHNIRKILNPLVAGLLIVNVAYPFPVIQTHADELSTYDKNRMLGATSIDWQSTNIREWLNSEKNTVDYTPPVPPTITPSETKLTNQNVAVTIGYASDSAKKEYRVNGKSWLDYTDPIELEKNAVIEARATDAIGNVSYVSRYEVNNIDPTPTTFTITPSTTQWTNQPVVLTIKGSPYIKQIILPDGTVVKGNSTQYTVTKNGGYEFVGLNADGRVSEVSSYSVTNIDEVGKDVLLVPGDGNWRNRDIEVQISTID